MKWFVGLALFLWLLCGSIAASWLGDHSWKTIALEPFSLAKAYNDNPVNYPGP